MVKEEDIGEKIMLVKNDYENEIYTREKTDDPIFQYMQDRLYKEIIKDFDIGDSKKLLDVGCGVGGLIDYFNGNINYYGIDISKLNIKHIRKDYEGFMKNNNITLKRHDITKKFPFKDNTFDYIVCSEVIEHLDNTMDLMFVIKEIKRVAKRGANIVITAPSLKYLWAYLPWNIHPFKRRSKFKNLRFDVASEKYIVPHFRFKPKWLKEIVSNHLWIEELDTTFWYNNRVIHGILPGLQMLIHKLSWFGTCLGNNIIIRCRKL